MNLNQLIKVRLYDPHSGHYYGSTEIRANDYHQNRDPVTGRCVAGRCLSDASCELLGIDPGRMIDVVPVSEP